ncbi:4803_t:CDS:1 [Ambispora leptoticha]|uniref:4803_t:CDS:1 n=1 Tax=Ambispora leptoticha TaxID=144679 RepID=A0A9N8WNJ6_9GLOM|nr:4803_t:CDS:1 [Ambispora leptoticha]
MPIDNLEQIIREHFNTIRIEKVIIFSTPKEDNCAIVISRVTVYAVRLAIYDPKVGEVKDKRYPDSNPVNGYTTLKKALRQAIDVRLEKEVNDTLEVNSLTSQKNLDNNDSDNVRTILLIGHTGSGKSALANVITDTTKFKESEFTVAETRNIQSEKVVINGIRYNIIDTPGIADTKLPSNEVHKKIVEGACQAKDGLYQILFVTNGKLTQVEIEAYNLLRTIIFDEGVSQYTTLVRTNFPSFQDKAVLYDDLKKMIKENNDIVELIRSCRDIIYVNNPSLNCVENNIEMFKNIRNASRKILIDALSTCGENTYEAKGFYSLSHRIKEPMAKKEILQQNLESIDENDPQRELLATIYREKIEEMDTYASELARYDIMERSQSEYRRENSLQRAPTDLANNGNAIITAVIQGLFS